MNSYLLRLAAKLLRMAADEFSNHGCNDFDLDKFLTKEQQLEFVATVAADNRDSPEDTKAMLENPRWAVQDWHAMAFLASFLEGLANLDSAPRNAVGVEKVLTCIKGAIAPDEEGALDELVHDASSNAASIINNQGVEAQVEYLLDNGLTEEGILEWLMLLEEEI
jgi:hypothetical protein